MDHDHHQQYSRNDHIYICSSEIPATFILQHYKWSWYPNIEAVYAGMLSDVTYLLDLVTTLQMRNRVHKALSYHFVQTQYH